MAIDKYTTLTASGNTGMTLISAINWQETAGSTAEIQLLEAQSAPGALTPTNANVDGLVEAGVHSYKVTFVNATGETEAGTVSADVTVGVDAPGAATAALVADATPAQIDAGDHSYKVTFVTASGETAAGTASNSVTNDASNTQNSLTGIPLGPTGTTSRNIYRNKVADQTHWFLQQAIADNTTTTATDITADASLTTAAPTANTSKGKVSLSAIPVGPTGTTSRKIYRNEAGGAPGTYKLKVTLANNSATTATDNVADATGATAPTYSTAGAIAWDKKLTANEGNAFGWNNPVTTDPQAAVQKPFQLAVVSGAVRVVVYGR